MERNSITSIERARRKHLWVKTAVGFIASVALAVFVGKRIRPRA